MPKAAEYEARIATLDWDGLRALWIAIEQWDKGGSKSSVSTLPEQSGPYTDNGHFFAGLSHDDVYLTVGGVTAGGGLYHFDGTSWSEVAMISRKPETTISNSSTPSIQR